MPEETANQPSVQAGVPQNTLKKHSNLTIILILIFTVILLGSLFVLYLFSKNDGNSAKEETGLEVENVNLGWKSLSGIYPKNSSPPINEDINFNDAIFETLTKVTNSSVEPSLATKWTNPNSTTWKFEIRSDVKFHTGETMTVDDVKYSFDQVIASAADEENSWSSSGAVVTIKEVRKIDEKTLEIETQKPDPILLNRITEIYILSKAQIEKDGLDKAVGTGPFKVVSFEAGKGAVLERNNGYWGEKPKAKKVTFKVYGSNEELIAALKKGDVDYARVGLANVSLGANFEIKTVDEPKVVMLFFNFAASKINGAENPLLKNKVREAIKLSIDSNKIMKEASVSGRAANQFLTRSIVGYNSKIQSQARSISEAKALLETEKVPNLTFTIYTTTDREAVAKSVAAQLLEAGITAKVQVTPTFGELVGMLFDGQAEAFIASPSATDGGEYIDAIFKTEGEQNILSYSNETVDEELSKANNSFNPKERRESLEGIVENIMNDNPVIPLFATTNSYIMRDQFDFATNSFGDFLVESINGRKIFQGN